ncbi:carbohydrate ABC transporter permease [Pseudokineococcus marinus]|uniref:Carbohydrate ABC transporter permease n=1 Tax=Pseudokineococcus marinus TaxID=351215 RepID=A0A849BMV4_9ACTN|nr:carbohydrate ABC transporter permease [Pseudokineococcus marinus]NNH22377.1 carbohydrate ABC transporter permease [Pseudokineococcus marinus]
MTSSPDADVRLAAPVEGPAEPRRSRRRADDSAGPLTYVILTITALLFLFPFYYSLVAASHTPSDLYDGTPPLFPGPAIFDNMRLALEQADLVAALGRSLVVSLAVTATTVFFCTLAGFAFAKARFRGRNALFGITVATLTIPPTLSIIPLYVVMTRLGLVNNLMSVILPSAVTAFGVFFMRQFISQALPDELVEAARVDGASLNRTVFSIVFPLARPGMAVLGILSFMAAWNDFLWPFIVVRQSPTIQVAVAGIGAGYTPDISVILAGTVLATVPLLVVTAIFGRQIVGGITAGAIKG